MDGKLAANAALRKHNAIDVNILFYYEIRSRVEG